MTMKERLPVLRVFVMVIVVFVLTHVAGHLAFVLQKLLRVDSAGTAFREKRKNSRELERRKTPWAF